MNKLGFLAEPTDALQAYEGSLFCRKKNRAIFSFLFFLGC